MTLTEAELIELTFGIELEYDRITTEKAAKTVAEVVGGTYRYEGWHLSNWVVTMPDGRKWNCETDASVRGGSETVSPILRFSDIPMVQEVVRALRRAGARAGGGAGLHIHVGAAHLTPKQIQNLVKIFYKQEELIVHGCGTSAYRLGRYTRRTDRAFVDRMLKLRNPTMAKLGDAYYYGVDDRCDHYCEARYCTLNLHNLWNGGKRTVEFRLFEATTHAGEIRTNILLALSIVRKAMNAKAASARGQRAYNETSAKYDLRVFLLRLGWNGEMFKAPRKHLLKRMPGSAAWKNGRQD